MSTRSAVIGMAFLLAGAPSASFAETVLAPFVGTTFGGGAHDDFGSTQHLVYGGTLSFLATPLGFEIDGQYSPHFFGDTSGSNVASFMGGLTLGGGEPGGLRVYAVAGAGLLKSRVPATAEFFETDRNSFGIELGGSLIVPVSRSLGLKGDLRYFRGLSDLGSSGVHDIDLSGFHFWRASGGLAFRF